VDKKPWQYAAGTHLLGKTAALADPARSAQPAESPPSSSAGHGKA